MVQRFLQSFVSHQQPWVYLKSVCFTFYYLWNLKENMYFVGFDSLVDLFLFNSRIAFWVFWESIYRKLKIAPCCYFLNFYDMWKVFLYFDCAFQTLYQMCFIWFPFWYIWRFSDVSKFFTNLFVAFLAWNGLFFSFKVTVWSIRWTSLWYINFFV